MCKYCEKRNVDGKMLCEAVPTRTNEHDVEMVVCIVPPTPISMRKYEKEGTTAEIQIGIFSDDFNATVSIPIKFCPYCGRDLNE